MAQVTNELEQATDAIYGLIFGGQDDLDATIEGLPFSLGSAAVGDLPQLRATLRRQALNTGVSGGTALSTCYPNTLSALSQLTEATKDEIVGDFLASDHFAEATVHGLHGPGISIEEAFYEFARPLLVERDRWVLEHEFTSVLLKLLAANESPAFTVRRPAVRNNGQALVAVVGYPAEIATKLFPNSRTGRHYQMYAAVNGRYISGKVSESLASCVLSGKADNTAAKEVSQLRELGLVA